MRKYINVLVFSTIYFLSKTRSYLKHRNFSCLSDFLAQEFKPNASTERQHIPSLDSDAGWLGVVPNIHNYLRTDLTITALQHYHYTIMLTAPGSTRTEGSSIAKVSSRPCLAGRLTITAPPRPTWPDLQQVLSASLGPVSSSPFLARRFHHQTNVNWPPLTPRLSPPRRRDCCLLSNYSVCLEFIFKWPVVWFIRPVKTESLAVDRACWETIDKSKEWGDDLLTTKDPVDEKEDALVLKTKQRLLLRLHYYYTSNETARHLLLYPVINKP